MRHTWKEEGACVDVTNPDIFFPLSPVEFEEAGVTGNELIIATWLQSLDTAEAKRYCGECEVRKSCGLYARKGKIKEGIWDGKLRGV